MEISYPTISVCIPTWNRSKYLKECLDSIVCQFSDESVYNKVEIVISDNASNDDTEVVVNKYQAKFNNIYYSKNDINIGFSRNVEKVIDCAHGKYVWLLGDDDIVVVDSLKVLLNKTNNKEYAAILLNFYQGEFNNPQLKIIKNSLHNYRDKEYLNSRILFKNKESKNFYAVNFISVIIVNRILYQKNKDIIKTYLNTLYYQAYIFLITAIGGATLRIAKPLVGYRRTMARRPEIESGSAVDQQVLAGIALQEKQQFTDFINYAKIIGYELDENFSADIFFSTKNYYYIILNKVINLLIRLHLIKFARIFYRLPRLVQYYAKKKTRMPSDNRSTSTKS
ncbi:MAG: glycosyltransferase [Candidatus Falkowbacteria bacterium]